MTVRDQGEWDRMKEMRNRPGEREREGDREGEKREPGLTTGEEEV